METITAVGIVAECFALFALTGAIADLVMSSPVGSVEEWLAALRLISSTEPTGEGIFPEFQGGGRFGVRFAIFAARDADSLPLRQ